MTYRRSGDDFLLNGEKYLISNGGIAGVIVTFAYPEMDLTTSSTALSGPFPLPGTQRRR